MSEPVRREEPGDEQIDVIKAVLALGRSKSCYLCGNPLPDAWSTMIVCLDCRCKGGSATTAV